MSKLVNTEAVQSWFTNRRWNLLIGKQPAEKLAISVLQYAAQITYQGVLYMKIVMRSHGTRLKRDLTFLGRKFKIFHLKTQSVPRSKGTPSRLQKPVSAETC